MIINILPFGILHIHSRFSLQCAGKTVLFTLNTPQLLESSSTYLSSKNEDTTWKQHIHSLSLTAQDEAFKNLIMVKKEGFRHVCTIGTAKQQLEDCLNYDGKIQIIGSIVMFSQCPVQLTRIRLLPHKNKWIAMKPNNFLTWLTAAAHIQKPLPQFNVCSDVTWKVIEIE